MAYEWSTSREEDKPRDEEKRHSHQYPVHPVDLRGQRLDPHDAAKLGGPWGRLKGDISYEDLIYFYQVVSIPTVVRGAGPPLVHASLLVPFALVLREQYSPAHAFDTNDTNLLALDHLGLRARPKKPLRTRCLVAESALHKRFQIEDNDALKGGSIMDEQPQSPFVIFDHGTPLYPPNDLHERTAEILENLGALAPEVAVCDLLRPRPLKPFSWHPAIGHIFHHYQETCSKYHGMEERLLSLIPLMIKRPVLVAWQALRDELVSQIDAYSGWSFSWQKDHAEKEEKVISRGPDGYYYTKLEDGTVVRIHGAKMSTEVRLDYIHDSVRSYGRVMQILDTFSLFAVSDDFQEHPDAYPASLRMVLGDKEWYRGRFPWHRMEHGMMRTSRWRPYSNLCDPEWLGEDMMARIVTASGGGTWDNMVTRYKDRPNQLDADCQQQLDSIVDTDLWIGDEDEVYFRFEGRTFRWINGTPQSSAILSIGTNGSDPHYRFEYRALNRLISTLVWLSGTRIVLGGGVGGRKRALPMTWAPRLSGGTKLPLDIVRGVPFAGKTQADGLALALFKEGTNANSVFYEYLNYWKVIEVAIPDKASRLAWINANAVSGVRQEEIPTELGKAKSIAEYLDHHCRSAIAHVFSKPYINPDEIDDSRRISKHVFLVEQLARRAMREVMGIN